MIDSENFGLGWQGINLRLERVVIGVLVMRLEDPCSQKQ